jgi:anti-anti-sigma factor
MSSQEVAHISYERIDHPRASLVEFLSHSIADPEHSTELSRQLASLVRPEVPNRYVLDFKNVRTFSSTGFGALVAFVIKVREAGGQVVICNMNEFVRFGADIIRLGDYAPIVADRQAALDRLAADETASEVPFVS